MPSCLVADLRHEHIAIVKEEKVGPPYCANPHSKHYGYIQTQLQSTTWQPHQSATTVAPVLPASTP